MQLYLVRHCEPEPEARGRCYGALDFGLSAGGRRAAEMLGASFASVQLDAVLSSPRRRALETAAPLAESHGLPVTIDDRYREIDFGAIEGLTYEEVEGTHPELYRRWMETPTDVEFPGGDSFATLQARVTAAVAERRRGTCAIVSHGGPIRAILAHCLGLPDASIFRIAQDYGGVSVVEWQGETPVVRLVNAPAPSR